MSKRVFSARYGLEHDGSFVCFSTVCSSALLYVFPCVSLCFYDSSVTTVCGHTDSVTRICDPRSSVLYNAFQLLSGTDKELANKKLRGEINVLLCGDPGTR